MKKLKIRIFLVVFLILSFVTAGVMVVENVQMYRQQAASVERGLSESPFDRFFDAVRGGAFSEDKSKERDKDGIGNVRFMDTTVYTVVLMSDNSMLSVINHSDNDVTDDEIAVIAATLIQENQPQKIGNLFFDRYSYRFSDGNYIIIVDNTETNSLLRGNLLFSVVVFCLLEALIAFVAYYLSKRIARPVEESFEKQKRFIADASHELKTPLAVIVASADALEREPGEEKWLNNIKSESDRMSHLIADLLDLAKSEEAEDRAAYAPGNLSKTVETAALTFEGVMYEKGVTLTDDIQENVTMNMNTFKIKQLMSILLDNAVQHSENGGEIRVTLKADKSIVLSVTNRGEGIPAGEEEKIFERFYRADESRNRNDNRYGLGLAIARNIVQNHGGTISAKSENGTTEFRAVFPK